MITGELDDAGGGAARGWKESLPIAAALAGYRREWLPGDVAGGISACVVMIPGQADFLATLYTFGAMLSFTIAHLAVIRLRRTQPDAHRPYVGHAAFARAADEDFALLHFGDEVLRRRFRF